MNNPDPKNLSLRQIVEDAHELTQYLKRKFGRDKIYLAGFSWGSMVGLKLIEQYPEDYLAYFGIAQALNLRKSITLSRDWIMQQAQTKNDQESVRILKRLDQGDTTLCKGEMECFIKQHELLSKYGGAVYTKAAEAEILKAETTYEDYKNYDWFAGFTYSAHRLEKDMFETDLTVIKDLKIPVYFLLGRHDWTLPTALTEEFVKNLNAPKKEIIWFEQSGHEVPEEEAPVFNKVLMDRVRN